MTDKELERLMEAQSRKDKLRHPFLHKAVPAAAAAVMLGSIIGGMCCLGFRFPVMNTHDLSYKVAGWIIVAIGAVVSIIIVTAGVKLQNWLDRRDDKAKHM